MAEKKRRRTSFEIPPSDYEALKKIAEAEERSVGFLIRKSIKNTISSKNGAKGAVNT
jgi:hypothetical protein